MNRRRFLELTSGALVAGSAGLLQTNPAHGRPTSTRPPNVILILTDDQGYGDIGMHGNEFVQTPHLDRLAAEGVEFTDFHVSPWCIPTRASLLTGRYYYRTLPASGGTQTARRTSEITVAEMLRSVGYRTAIVGKWHLYSVLGFWARVRGFDSSLLIRDLPPRPPDGEQFPSS